MVGNRNQPTYTNEEINHNKRYESNSTGNEIESVMKKNNKIDNHNIENNIPYPAYHFLGQKYEKVT